MLTTLISMVFVPPLTASVMSTLNGAFQYTPRFLPFTVTSARSFTSPRSRMTASWSLISFFFSLKVLEYVAAPEKYLIPNTGLSVREASLSKVALSGAPRPSWNETVQGVSISDRVCDDTWGRTTLATSVSSVRTTKTDWCRARLIVTFVLPSANS